MTNGGATIIAVGAQGHAAVMNTGQGTVYLFSGSGTSFPLQFELNNPNPSAYGFGESVALVSNGGTNTLAVGIANNSRSPNGYTVGAVMVFTGSGTSYSAVTLTAADNQPTVISHFGGALAVGVLNGVTTVVTSDPASGDRRLDGGVYVFAGSGASYTQTKLTDASNAAYDNFGVSVAVGYSYSQTIVAVGASGKNSNTLNPADGVLLFSQTGDSYAQSSLPQSNGFAGDHYGSSVAMQAVSNGDPIVVGGAFGSLGSNPPPGAATVSSWSAQASVQATFGDGSQLLVSPAASPYSGIPFHLVASVVDGNGNAIPPTGVTFIVQPNGNTGGLFTASDPASTTLHVTTHDGTSGTTAGQTDTISLFPSSTAGSFIVTVAADGTALSAAYALTIIAYVPTPTVNAVIPVQTTGAVARNSPSSATGSLPPGFSPPLVIIDPTKTYTIHISGSGFVAESYIDPTDPNARFRTYYEVGSAHEFLLDTVYVSSTELLVTVSGPQGMFAGLTTDANATIWVRNPSSSPGGPLGARSDFRFLGLVMPRPAQAGSTLSISGATHVIVPPDYAVVPSLGQVLDSQGNPSTGIATGIATGVVGSKGGSQIIAQGGGNIIAQGGGNIIAQGGGNIVSGKLITNDGGSLVPKPVGASAQNGVAKPSSQSPASNPAQNAPVGSAPKRTTVSSSSTNGDYIASTDAHGIIMAPPVLSNGIPGTFTRTLSVDGIAPVTYTITNLNPHDGHPTTITALSRTTASTGDPSFILTVTGTGFITTNGGSVLSYGGVQLVTAVTSPTQLHATIPADLLNYTGPKDVLVINPDPNGGASLPATFTVTHATTMTLAGLSPSSIAPNGPAFTLTATGTNFVNGATVEWNSTPLATTYVSTTSLTAIVPASLVAQGGTAQVTVADPLGGATVALVFTVLTPNALPPPQPPSGPTGGPSPLPGARQPAGPPLGNPNPLPPSR
ncbi:MAG: beta strand repeat-containing protein [Thermomicrobiales bacterium]